MLLGRKTIRAGEGVAVWNGRGEVRTVEGPCVLWLWRARVEPLPQHVATEGQYLIVSHRDGRLEHVSGPARLWQHPVEHREIRVASALAINEHEAVVAYGRDGDRVRRRIVHGPTQFVPASGEWLHAFSWHGADPQCPTRKIPRALQFAKLRIIPDQMYVEVKEVRSADDALLSVMFMVFFELTDIERMLDQTHDPLADLLNALTADTIEFAAARPFDRFKADTAQLNELASFRQLNERAQRIGYRIGKVVYRGYHANPQLQAMHDHAIEARTQLRLEAETEEQAQALADLKLARERQRAAQKQEMATDAARHTAALERLAIEERLARERLAGAARRVEREADQAQRLQHRQALDQAKLAYTGGLRAAGVDLTRWLVARYQNPDRLIRIEGNAAVQFPLQGA